MAPEQTAGLCQPVPRKPAAALAGRGPGGLLALLTVALLACATLIACTTVTVKTPDGERVTRSKDEFGDYVEHVFRTQNRALNKLIFLDAIGPGGGVPEDLLAAEEQMVLQCGGINELVARYLDGRPPSMLARRRLVNNIAWCETAALDLENLVDSYGVSASDLDR